jgi:hypothetical protein
MFANRAARAAFDAMTQKQKAFLERVVASTLYVNSRGNQSGLSQHTLLAVIRRRRGYSKGFEHAIPAVLDELMAQGVLVLGTDDFGEKTAPFHVLRYVQPLREGKTNREAAEAYRAGWAARVAPDIDAQRQSGLADLLGRARKTALVVSTDNGMLALRTAPGKGVAFAVGYVSRVVSHPGVGVAVGGLWLHALMDDGTMRTMHVRGADAVAIETGYPEDSIVVTVDLTKIGKDSFVRSKGIVALPFTKLGYAAREFDMTREPVEAWLGTPVKNRTWKAFVKNARRGLGGAYRDRKAGAALRRHLSPEVASVAARIPGRTISFFDYNHFVAPDATRRLYRKQAVDTYPLFAGLIVNDMKLRGLVDVGEPLAPELRKRTGLSAAVLRRVGGTHWQRCGAKTWKEINLLSGHSLKILSVCPIERLPVTKKDWEGLARLSKYLEDEGRFIRREKTLQAVVSSASRNWAGFDVAWRRIRDMLVDVSNIMRNIVVQRPELSKQAVGRANRKVCFQTVCGEERSMAELLDLTERWHARHRDIYRKLEGLWKDERLPFEWPPLDEPYSAPGGGAISWLTDKTMLTDEGRLLRHCVASYEPNCMYHGSHIGAVTGADGGRATVEIRAVRAKKGDGAEWQLSVRQHYGLNDRPASADCVAVVNAFLRERSGHVDCEGLEAARKRRADMMKLRGGKSAVFPADDPEARRIALELYREFLPRDVRHLSDEDIVARLMGELAPPKRKRGKSVPAPGETVRERMSELDEFIAAIGGNDGAAPPAAPEEPTVDAPPLMEAA